MPERIIKIDTKPAADGSIEVETTGHTVLYSHNYDNLDDAAKATQKRLNRHVNATRVLTVVSGGLTTAGSYTMLAGFERESAVISTVGAFAMAVGSIGLTEVFTNSQHRLAELRQELDKIRQLAGNL